MKKVMITLIVMLTTCIGTQAMGYEQARREALFLTDKMAYELNLTDAQYDAAYEINLDYLLGVTDRSNVFGIYWERRNLDFSYILLDWQYTAFCAARYFYRPLYWDAGHWHFGIYTRYPVRTYFYFGHPTVYASYRGGHSWHSNGGRSFWQGQRQTFNHGGQHVGMRDNHHNVGGGHNGNSRPSTGTNHGGNRNHGNNRNGIGTPNGNNRHNMGRPNSSTRVTVNGENRNGAGAGTSTPSTSTPNTSTPSTSGSRFGGARSNAGGAGASSGSSSFRESRSTQRSTSSFSNSGSRSNSGSSFSGTRSGSGSRSTGGSHSGGSRSGGFGGGRR